MFYSEEKLSFFKNLPEKFKSHFWSKVLISHFAPPRNIDENSKKKQQSEEDSRETLKTSEVCLN